MIARERVWLVDWVESCPHTAEKMEVLNRLDEGSEHIVYPERLNLNCSRAKLKRRAN
jgi:hypothetical protein